MSELVLCPVLLDVGLLHLVDCILGDVILGLWSRAFLPHFVWDISWSELLFQRSLPFIELGIDLVSGPIEVR